MHAVKGYDCHVNRDFMFHDQVREVDVCHIVWE